MILITHINPNASLAVGTYSLTVTFTKSLKNTFILKEGTPLFLSTNCDQLDGCPPVSLQACLTLTQEGDLRSVLSISKQQPTRQGQSLVSLTRLQKLPI